MSAPNGTINLTPEQWRDRAFVMDALRTRLGELVEAAQAFGAIKDEYHRSNLPIGHHLNERDYANLREHRARQAVEDFVAALLDRTIPRPHHGIAPPATAPLWSDDAIAALIARHHDLSMDNPWAPDAEPPQPNPFGMCSDEPNYIDRGEGLEC